MLSVLDTAQPNPAARWLRWTIQRTSAVCSCYGHHLRPKDARRDYQGQVDYFGVYCPDTITVYLVPIADLSVRVQAALRVEPARNGQKCNIRLASNYEIGKVNVEAPQRAPQLS